MNALKFWFFITSSFLGSLSFFFGIAGILLKGAYQPSQRQMIEVASESPLFYWYINHLGEMVCLGILSVISGVFLFKMISGSDSELTEALTKAHD